MGSAAALVIGAQIAKRAGISHNQLTRLSDQTFGLGVAAYMRKRRLDKAEHLLDRSNLPIKAIAAEMGIPDLQQFNKFMRKETGSSPTKIRLKRPPREALIKPKR